MACIFAGLAIIDGRMLKLVLARPRSAEVEKIPA
jgi:hypothetical protein